MENGVCFYGCGLPATQGCRPGLGRLCPRGRASGFTAHGAGTLSHQTHSSSCPGLPSPSPLTDPHTVPSAAASLSLAPPQPDNEDPQNAGSCPPVVSV